MGNKKLSTMKSIIFFTLFNMIAYISSKSHSKKVKTTIPSNYYCRTTLMDDDSGSSIQNKSYDRSFAISNLVYGLEDDLKEIYIENRLSPANGKFNCKYTLNVCKNHGYGRCATFTGEIKPGVKRGLKANHPAYASYFGDADSVKNTVTMVDRNPPPAVVKPVVKPEQTPIIASTGTTQDDIMERQIGTRR